MKAVEIDQIIARRLRAIRRARGLKQQELAEMLGISFQQVQKYEAAANRISASRLGQLSEILGVEISDFFGEPSREKQIDSEAMEAAIVLSSIREPKVRQSLIDLILSYRKN